MARAEGPGRDGGPDGGWVRAIDLAVVGVLLLLAAVLRFVDLPTRGTWDADQGHEMLMLLGLVRDGTWPLLGDATSIGGVHQGALYYYLLAPAAWLSDSDPVAVVGEIALLGTVAVGLVWWITRSVAGPVAGFVAGLVAAVSATAISRSTFIWNPNVLAFATMLAVSGAYRAWESRRARWWTLAAVGLTIAIQSHLLGILLAPPLVAWYAADMRRRSRGDRGGLARAGVVAMAIIAVGYVPLVVHDLGHDFAEIRALVAFITAGGEPSQIGPVTRLVFVGLRILAWPLIGLPTDALAVAVVAAVLVLAVLAWRLRSAAGAERTLLRWIAATLAWCWLVLGLGVSGLAAVTPLPVDHYHAFLDPLVFVVVGLGVGALWNGRRAGSVGRASPSTIARVAVVAVVAALAAWNVATWPPSVSPDGGWPAAQAAARRIEGAAGSGPISLLSLPAFKTAEAYEFPLAHDGRTITDQSAAASLVVVCDALFVADCGGSAEREAVAGTAFAEASDGPVDRFEAAPGRTISVYLRR